ncbi:MAG: hypothetical protein ACNYPH_04780 [Gammaproteobacteria bacterium WSBS_2016_MAG_OTU1]
MDHENKSGRTALMFAAWKGQAK